MATELEHTLEELSAEECWQLLEGGTVGRLAVSIADKPDIFPVNYRIDGRTIVVRTAPGLKLAAATLGWGVAFEVDDLDLDAHTGSSVVVRGPAYVIEDYKDRLDAERLEVQPWVAGPKNQYIRIDPTHVTGRRIL